MSPVNELHDYRTYLQQGEKAQQLWRNIYGMSVIFKPICRTGRSVKQRRLLTKNILSALRAVQRELHAGVAQFIFAFIGEAGLHRHSNSKVQRQIFCSETKALTLKEYQRLVKAAGNARISLVLQTICGTGIRVSELQAITVEAVREGKAVINCKNKTRVIFLPSSLQKLLSQYIKSRPSGRGSLSDKTGQTFEQVQYLEGNESALQKSRRIAWRKCSP